MAGDVLPNNHETFKGGDAHAAAAGDKLHQGAYDGAGSGAPPGAVAGHDTASSVLPAGKVDICGSLDFGCTPGQPKGGYSYNDSINKIVDGGKLSAHDQAQFDKITPPDAPSAHKSTADGILDRLSN
jgi:hypothetical protein